MVAIDYKQNFKENLEHIKSDLLQFLPEFFHPSIHHGTLNSEFPSAELRNKAEQWQNDYEQRMKELYQKYHVHFESIKGMLPKNVVQLHENSLHDAKVKSFEYPSKDTFVMTLDCIRMSFFRNENLG